MDYRLLSSPDLTMRTRWYIGVRWFYLAAIVIPGVLSLYIGEGWSNQVQRDAFLGGLAIASNGIVYLFSKTLKSVTAFKVLAVALLVFDIILITYLIYTKGGVESRSPILYTIPILMSAAILGRRSVYTTALTSIIVYDAVIISDFLGIIHSIGAANPNLRTEFPYMLNTVAFFSSILLVIATAVDFITRLLRDKEQQAVESLESLNRAQSIAKFGSWTWNIKTDTITWSRQLYTIFGISDRSTVITIELYFSLIHPDDVKRVRSEIQKALRRRNSFSFDYRLSTPEGIRYVHSDGQVIEVESGAAVKVIGTARDITEEKMLDSAKNEFVALASHQLRTPTTVVKQYLSMLIDGYAGALSSAQKKFVTVAYSSNEQQLTTINDLLSVAQIDSGKMNLHRENIDIVEFLNDLVTRQSIRLTDKHQTLTLTTRHKKLYTKADKNRLRMALENIIDNAHKYSPEHKAIKIILTKSGRFIYIAIKDQGIGIDAQDLPKVFKKFSRIENPASLDEEGTGLGLYWVDKVIRLHGGKITVGSKLHHGTTFTVSLPVKNT